MIWHFSLALAAEFSAASFVDSEQYALLKSTRTAERCSFEGKKKASSRRSQYGTTYAALKAIGNGQVPEVVKAAWCTLSSLKG
jgi:hypothetical protein